MSSDAPSTTSNNRTGTEAGTALETVTPDVPRPRRGRNLPAADTGTDVQLTPPSKPQPVASPKAEVRVPTRNVQTPRPERAVVSDAVPPTEPSLLDTVVSYLKFIYVIPFVGLCAAIYFFMIADRLSVSDAVISIRDQGQSTSGIGSILQSGLFGGSGGNNEDATLVSFIQSREMLEALDKKLNLRKAYSSSDWSIFTRMNPNAKVEDFLTFYQSTVSISVQSDVGIVTIEVVDPDAKRAQTICEAIVQNSEDFMNKMSDRMRQVSLQAAERELASAIQQVGSADPTQTAVAETRLTAAQTSLAGILGSNNQQLVFVMRISQPTLATEPTLPWRYVDVFGTMVLACAGYFILYLVWQNIRDHRKV
ncbi:MAG TPA: hypothetical protein VGG10_03225 [Rhizomicrobium sp.]|jgi:capsule polysaccharide export protein KpsE/RkpR